MRSNKISFAHKNRLILFTKVSRENQEKPGNFELCSTPIAISKEIQRHSLNSREKQNRKIITNQNFQIAQPKQGNLLKLRSYSTNLDSKPQSNISNMQLKKKQLRLLQWNKSDGLEKKVGQLVEELKRKFIISQNHLTNYTIKKDYFHHLLYHIASAATNRHTQYIEDDFASISKVFDEIGAQISLCRHDSSREKLSIQSLTTQHTVSRSDYLQQTVAKMSQIQKLNRSRDGLLEELKKIEKFKNDIVKQVQQNQLQINEGIKTIQRHNTEINASERQLEDLKKQLKDYNEEVGKIKQASIKISSYVGTQPNKLVAMASEQYKNIESQIYEYASYLQCNQLASSLDYEPLTITCITENLEEQLKTINRTLIQNEQLGAKEKGKLMRDFLLQWMNRYKKKDDEQKELMAFKTKCVQNFIQKMKKWLDNWTLKQEYLVGLRDQFALDTSQINSWLKELSTHSLCDSCSKIRPIITSLSQAYGKIENNYKMGNSFY